MLPLPPCGFLFTNFVLCESLLKLGVACLPPRLMLVINNKKVNKVKCTIFAFGFWVTPTEANWNFWIVVNLAKEVASLCITLVYTYYLVIYLFWQISRFVLPPFESTCILKDNEIIR